MKILKGIMIAIVSLIVIVYVYSFFMEPYVPDEITAKMDANQRMGGIKMNWKSVKQDPNRGNPTFIMDGCFPSPMSHKCVKMRLWYFKSGDGWVCNVEQVESY